jgi:rubrerythrin
MEIDLQYVKELENYNLKVKDLTEDGKTGVSEIKKTLDYIRRGENSGKTPSDEVLRKIKTIDKWVCFEIYDMVEDTDENDDEMPYDSEEIIEELEEDYAEDEDDLEKDEQPENVKQVVKTNADGNKINSELVELGKSGKNEYTIDEIKRVAPTTYKAIFDVYQKGEQNGVQTHTYSLIEFEEQKYKLTKI